MSKDKNAVVEDSQSYESLPSRVQGNLRDLATTVVRSTKQTLSSPVVLNPLAEAKLRLEIGLNLSEFSQDQQSTLCRTLDQFDKTVMILETMAFRQRRSG